MFIVCVLWMNNLSCIAEKTRLSPISPCFMGTLFQISSAACGYGFTLLSSKTKDVTKVWGMGLNKDSQLGFHRSRKDTSECSHLGFPVL